MDDRDLLEWELLVCLFVFFNTKTKNIILISFLFLSVGGLERKGRKEETNAERHGTTFTGSTAKVDDGLEVLEVLDHVLVNQKLVGLRVTGKVNTCDDHHQNGRSRKEKEVSQVSRVLCLVLVLRGKQTLETLVLRETEAEVLVDVLSDEGDERSHGLAHGHQDLVQSIDSSKALSLSVLSLFPQNNNPSIIRDRFFFFF